MFQFPELKVDTEIITKVFKLSCVFVGMVTFNNLCESWQTSRLRSSPIQPTMRPD
jgi:hypothetical protein